MVENLPSNTGDVSVISSQSYVQQATGQLSPCAITTEPAPSTAGALKQGKPSCAAMKTQRSQN